MAIAPNTDCLRHHKQLVDYLTLPCGLSEYRCHFARPFLFCPSPAPSFLPILCSSRDFGTILPFGSMRRWDKILTHLSCSFSSVFADSLSNSRLPTPSRDVRRQRERERERESELPVAASALNYVRPDTMKYPFLVPLYSLLPLSLSFSLDLFLCSLVRFSGPNVYHSIFPFSLHLLLSRLLCSFSLEPPLLTISYPESTITVRILVYDDRGHIYTLKSA